MMMSVLPAQTTATTEVTAAVSTFMNYINQVDLDNLLEMYSKDTSILPPTGNSVYGIEAARAFWLHMFQTVEFGQIKYTIEKIEQLSEDTVAEMSQYKAEIAGQPVQGKYVMIWKKIRGVWKVHVDIFNSAN
jgi:ketosteroid isomerase-like protein